MMLNFVFEFAGGFKKTWNLFQVFSLIIDKIQFILFLHNKSKIGR